MIFLPQCAAVIGAVAIAGIMHHQGRGSSGVNAGSEVSSLERCDIPEFLSATESQHSFSSSSNEEDDVDKFDHMDNEDFGNDHEGLPLDNANMDNLPKISDLLKAIEYRTSMAINFSELLHGHYRARQLLHLLSIRQIVETVEDSGMIFVYLKPSAFTNAAPLLQKAVVQLRITIIRIIGYLMAHGIRSPAFSEVFGNEIYSSGYNLQTVILRLLFLLDYNHFIFSPYDIRYAPNSDEPLVHGDAIPDVSGSKMLFFVDPSQISLLQDYPEIIEEHLMLLMIRATGVVPNSDPIMESPSNTDFFVNEGFSTISDEFTSQIQDVFWQSFLSRSPQSFIGLYREILADAQVYEMSHNLLPFFDEKSNAADIDCERIGVNRNSITLRSFLQQYRFLIMQYGIEDVRKILPRLNPAELYYVYQFIVATGKLKDSYFMFDFPSTVYQAMLFIPMIVEREVKQLNSAEPASIFTLGKFDADLHAIAKTFDSKDDLEFKKYLSVAVPVRTAIDSTYPGGKIKLRALVDIQQSGLKRSLTLMLPEIYSKIKGQFKAKYYIGKVSSSKPFYCTGFWNSICKKFNAALSKIFIALNKLHTALTINESTEIPSEDIITEFGLARVTHFIAGILGNEHILIANYPKSFFSFKKIDPYQDWRSSFIMFPGQIRWIFSRSKSAEEFILGQLVELQRASPSARYEAARDMRLVQEDEESEKKFIEKMLSYLSSHMK